MGGKGDADDIGERVSTLEEMIKNTTSEYDKEKL